jgi:hypothetical protein
VRNSKFVNRYGTKTKEKVTNGRSVFRITGITLRYINASIVI